MFTLETVALDSGSTVAIAKDGRYVPIGEAGARLGIPIADTSLFALLDTWEESWSAIARIAEKAIGNPDFEVKAGAAVNPFGHARKVLCAGANYYKHLEEMDVTFKKEPGKSPFFFLKPPTALVGAGPVIPLDPTIKMLDWEVEMAVVIGRAGRDIPVSKALEHVAGYTVANDITARDRLFEPESIFKFNFVAGKGRDGYCPIAPQFLPAAFLQDPQATRLRLSVNGVSKQDSSTDDMIYSVAEIISWGSKIMTLEPGDVILTGSPAGVGFPKREFLKVGDVIRCELDPGISFETTVVGHE